MAEGKPCEHLRKRQSGNGYFCNGIEIIWQDCFMKKDNKYEVTIECFGNQPELYNAQQRTISES